MLKVKEYDVADFLDTPEDIAAYINVVIEEGDENALAEALGDVARSRGMTKLAEDTGLNRVSLYSSLSAKGSPRLSTILRVLKSYGLKIQVVPADKELSIA